MRGQMTHLDSDVLAEFRAGLITGRRRARMAAHLAVCDRCSALSGQLAEVSALLAAVPAPAVPDSVAQRLETALAAENEKRRDDSERAGADRSRDRVTDPRPARHRGWRLVSMRVLAPAAAVVVLVAGGYGLSLISGGPTSSTASSGSAAEPAATKARPAAGTASHPALFPAIKGSSVNVVTSSTDYRHATLSHQLEQAMRASGPALPAQAASAQLQGCVRRVTSGVSPGTPVLVENARYQGRPATVIVASSGNGYAAWVMAPGCSASRGDVLDRATLPGTSAP